MLALPRHPPRRHPRGDAAAPPVAGAQPPDAGAPPVPGAPPGSTEPPRNADDESQPGRVTYMPITSSSFDDEDVVDHHPVRSTFDQQDKIDYHPVP